MRKLDLLNPVRTRGGNEVRIFTTDCRGQDPVVGEMWIDGNWKIYTWAVDGKFSPPGCNDRDLVNIPNEHTVWVAFCRRETGPIYSYVSPTKEECIKRLNNDVIACMEVTFPEGQGL